LSIRPGWSPTWKEPSVAGTVKRHTAQDPESGGPVGDTPRRKFDNISGLFSLILVDRFRSELYFVLVCFTLKFVWRARAADAACCIGWESRRLRHELMAQFVT
jgi:hypothetical protein